MGIQASGKGSVARKLAEAFCVDHIEIGRMCRARAREDDEVGRAIKARMDVGQLVSEAVIVQALAERLAEARFAGFVLDGFPRTGNQVATLDAMLESLGVKLDAPIYLELDPDTARRRIEDRLVCTVCGDSTNVHVAKEHGLCPKAECGGKLTRRDDDQDPEAVSNRISQFVTETLPVIQEYADSDRLITIDASRDPSIVYAEIVARVKGAGPQLAASD